MLKIANIRDLNDKPSVYTCK